MSSDPTLALPDYILEDVRSYPAEYGTDIYSLSKIKAYQPFRLSMVVKAALQAERDERNIKLTKKRRSLARKLKSRLFDVRRDWATKYRPGNPYDQRIMNPSVRLTEQVSLQDKDPKLGSSIQIVWRDFSRKKMWILTLFYADRDGVYAHGDFAPNKPNVFSKTQVYIPFEMGARGPVFTRTDYNRLTDGNNKSLHQMYDRALIILSEKKLLNPRRR